MSLPVNFSSLPGEGPRRDFRNLCIQFKKLVHSSQDVEELQRMMEQFISESRDLNWHHKTGDRYHKDEGEKATGKVFSEFKRYISALQKRNPEKANPQDLLDAISAVEQLIRSLKVT